MSRRWFVGGVLGEAVVGSDGDLTVQWSVLISSQFGPSLVPDHFGTQPITPNCHTAQRHHQAPPIIDMSADPHRFLSFTGDVSSPSLTFPFIVIFLPMTHTFIINHSHTMSCPLPYHLSTFLYWLFFPFPS